MDFEAFQNHPPGDPALVDKIVCQLKSQGIFDQFRKECISDVDTKPAYQNLRQRVDVSVAGFLANQEWKPDLNKNQLRESLRKHVQSGGFLDVGVERIVDQVVNPKICQVFLPQVEEVVYECLGIKQPKVTGEFAGSHATIISTAVPPPKIQPTCLRSNVDCSSSSLQPIASARDSKLKSDCKNTAFDNGEEKNNPSSFNPLNESDTSLDSHVSGITELASHSSLSLNISKESNASEDKDALEGNDIMIESVVKSEDSNVDSVSEALALPQSDTNTNISIFDSDSVADVNDHLRSENESTPNSRVMPINEDLGNSYDEMSLMNDINKDIKEELFGNTSDYSKNDSDDNSPSVDVYNGLKSKNWDPNYKERTEKEEERSILKRKDEIQKRCHSDNKKELSVDSFDFEERSLYKSETDSCAVKYNHERFIVKSLNESFVSDEDKIIKSSDDEKDRKESKKDYKSNDKNKSRDKDSRKDSHHKGHHSKENQYRQHHHHHHSVKEKLEKEFSLENSRDSKDSNHRNNIDKKSDYSKSKSKSRDECKHDSRSHDGTDRCKEGKEKERKKAASESSDVKHKESSRSRYHSDSKSKNRSDSDSRDRHSHHHHRQHEKQDSKEKSREDSKEYGKESSKNLHKEAFEDKTNQTRDKDTDSSRSYSKDGKRHHYRDRHDSSSRSKERKSQENLKGDKSHTELRKDEKKSSFRSHNYDREKSGSKQEPDIGKRCNENKSLEKNEEKSKKDERSRSKKTREHCKSSNQKEDRRSADRDSSGSGERGSRSSTFSTGRGVESRQSDKKEKDKISDKNVSDNSASDCAEMSTDIGALEVADDESNHTSDNSYVSCLNSRVIDGNESISACTANYSPDLFVQVTSSDTSDFDLNDSSKRTEAQRIPIFVNDNVSSFIPGNFVKSNATEIKGEINISDYSVSESLHLKLEIANDKGIQWNNDLYCCTEVPYVKSISSCMENTSSNASSKITGTKVEENIIAFQKNCSSLLLGMTDEGRININNLGITKSAVGVLKKSILARMYKNKITFNTFEKKKIRLARKNAKNFEETKLMVNFSRADDQFCYFKQHEIIAAKEKLKCFNSLFYQFQDCYYLLESADCKNTSSKLKSGNVKNLECVQKDVYAIKSKRVSQLSINEEILLVSGSSACSDFEKSKTVHIVPQTCSHDFIERKVKSQTINNDNSENKPKDHKIFNTNLNSNELKRSPVKLRISLKNPNDCKVIEIENNFINKEDSKPKSVSSLEKKTSVASEISSSNNVLCNNENEYSKENSKYYSEHRSPTTAPVVGLKRKRGRPKMKDRLDCFKHFNASTSCETLVFKENVNDSISGNIISAGKSTTQNMNSVVPSVRESLDVQRINSIMQKDVSRFTFGHAVSPKSPPNTSTNYNYVPLCLDDAAIPNSGSVTQCCILSRSDKSNNYKNFKESSYNDQNFESVQRYSPSPEGDTRCSYSTIKNVDIISPNRLNNNLSDPSDCADSEEGENYLTNPLIGEALQDLMQESGLVGGYTKVPVDVSNVRLRTGKLRKQLNDEGCKLRGNSRHSLSRRNRLSTSSKQTQRYDNSDLYKPRFGFRQRSKRKSSPEVPLTGSVVNEDEFGYSSSDVRRPSKRAR